MSKYANVPLSTETDYGGYLCLEPILSAQKPKSNQHDEMLFIIQHQTSELWMKLVVHELRFALEYVKGDDLEPSFKVLSRVKQIMRMMFEQWAVLETMTPSDYALFRKALGRASGFQSYQYRMIEFLLGNKDVSVMGQLQQRPEIVEILTKDLNSPSLYEEFLRYLDRKGLDVPSECISRDWSQPREESKALVGVFKKIYDNPRLHWGAYEMCEKLIDIDQMFQLWRFRHMQTVERIIGFKQGTGGSPGASYLRERARVHLFPELWSVRTEVEDKEIN
ncbi:MAG: tryptophan 2,3-dioxygenase family protein [Armatimonadota bacterium]